MKANSTKERLIITTAALIQGKGYYGTGLSEVLKEVGVPKGSLYHHFPGGKDEMVIAALGHAAGERALLFKSAMKGKPNAEEGLKAVVDVFLNDLIRTEFHNGCPLATVALEVAGQNETLQKECAALYDFWTDALSRYLDYKGEEGTREKAERFLMALEGAVMLSKVHQSPEPLEKMKNQIGPMIFRAGQL